MESIVRCNGHIYCGGYEYIDENGDKGIPVLWCDDVPTPLAIGSQQEDYYSGRVVEVVAYGDDVYTLTQEIFDRPNEKPFSRSILWLNGELFRIYDNLYAISFAVF